jgi:2-aminobenzoate-CoA ligase
VSQSRAAVTWTSFCADHLPPAELQACAALGRHTRVGVPGAIELRGRVARPDGRYRLCRPTGDTLSRGEWSYRELRDKANRIARVLVEDLGIVPGNRVLLRGANTPMLAACWFGVLKAGGVVVCTMALLRERELQYIAQKAAISLAITDARVAADCEAAVKTPVLRFGGDDPNDLIARMRSKPADVHGV